jgi:hypothetical protein
MPIIINDFEIIPAPPSQNASADPQRAQAPPPPALKPEDIERIEEHHRCRLARIRAE